MHVSACKPGYYYDDLSQMCIRIVEGSFLDYDSARRNCEAQGEQLVVVDTHEKMVFVENMLLRHSGTIFKCDTNVQNMYKTMHYIIMKPYH